MAAKYQFKDITIPRARRLVLDKSDGTTGSLITLRIRNTSNPL